MKEVIYFLYRSSVPIILQAFEMLRLNRPRYERDRKKYAQGKELEHMVMLCLHHSTCIVCLLSGQQVV